MTEPTTVGDDLKARYSHEDSKVKRLESALAAARERRDEIAVAMKVLAKLGYIEDPEAVASTNTNRVVGMNEAQSLVYQYVGCGEVGAMAPKDVTSILHSTGRDDLSADYVRTTLWRLAQRGYLKNEGGLYWRPEPAKAENVAAPGAETPRAVNESAGPHGGGSVFPASSPEGSIPSGSTPPKRGFVEFDETGLDDDIPF